MSFWKRRKEQERSDMMEILIDNYMKMKLRVDTLETDLQKLDTQVRSVRGKINRKIFTESEETEDIKTSDPFDFLRRKNGAI